ncbi:ABC transporter substrate-binding protein [Aeromicrobium panaciterrae]|uniref:ABC transporter substrate-binding protein n=1 Tax=Aeromicrobium panaciterrae TaxID=363861 RepID=UPI0031D51186
MRLKKLTAVIPIALTAALLTACGSGSDGAAAQAGGTLKFGGTVPDCADPHQRGNNPNSYALKPLADSLLAQNLKTGEYLPWLATKYEVSADAKDFTFTLRDDVTFSDGEKLDAQAVADNFDGIKKLGAAASLAIGYLNDYQRSEVVSPDKVVVHFSKPNIAFLQGTATGNLAIVAPKTSAQTAEERCAKGAIGSGPFVVTKYVPSETLTYKKRKDYAWGNPLAKNQGAAHLDGLEIVNIKDTAVLAGSLLSGQIDAYSVVLPQDASRIEGAGGKVLTTTNAGYPVALVPNVKGTVFSDPAVRQAVQIGFDRKAAIDGVIGDWFHASESALSTSTVGFKSQGDALSYQPDKARTLLDDAGWKVGAGGIREKDGKKLSFDVTWDSDWNATSSVLAIVKEQLKEIGVELTINLLPTGQAASVYDSGKFSARWVNGYTPEPDTLRAILSIDANNWLERAGREKLDDLLSDQLQAVDVTKRNGILAEIQKTVIDEGYLIPIYDWAQSFAVSSKVQGAKLAYLSGPGPLYADISLSK